MVYNGSKTSTTPGTPVTLAASRTMAQELNIQALTTNVGPVYIGGSTVAATSGTALITGDSVTFRHGGGLNIYDLSLVYLDVANSGDGVQFTYSRS